MINEFRRGVCLDEGPSGGRRRYGRLRHKSAALHGRGRHRSRLAGDDCAQRLAKARRVSIAQIHDAYRRRRARRRIQAFDQRTDSGNLRRVVRANEQAVRARVGRDQQPLLRCRCRPRRQFRQKLRDHRGEVEDGGVAERQYSHVARIRTIQGLDNLADPLCVVRIVGDDQRVAAGKRGDRVVRRDERPEDRQNLRGGFELERVDHRHDLVARRARAGFDHRAGILLRVRFRDDLGHAARLDRRKAVQAQSRQKHRVDLFARHRPRGDDVDRAFHARVEKEIAPCHLRDRFCDRIDLGVDEIQRDRLRRRRNHRCGKRDDKTDGGNRAGKRRKHGGKSHGCTV
jgi:hypothetical protein